MTFLQQGLICALIAYVVWRFAPRRSPVDNVPGPSSDSWLTGNMKLFQRDRLKFQASMVEQYGRLFKFHGLFNAKWLYTHDARALHSIYLKDHDVFEESNLILACYNAALGPGLMGTVAQQHRRQRRILNPVFSAKHLRDITPIFNEILGRLREAIASRIKGGPQEVDMLSWTGRAALELIGVGGLGHSFDPLTRDVADDFADAVKSFFPAMQQLEVPRMLVPRLAHVGTPGFRRAVLEMIPLKALKRMIHVTDTMHAQSVKIYNDKKAALEKGDEALKDQVGEGKDIISVLLRANIVASKEDRLSDEEVIAQISTMVLAGMDTTSNALARILYVLAEDQDAQQRLREEIVQARDDGSGHLRDLTYDEVMDLPYLDAVCRETLRRYTPVTILLREVRKDAILPLSTPIIGRDGQPMESIPVTKGTMVFTDILASNCDKELWGPDADEWKPERWLKPLPRTIEEAPIPGVYSHLMTFIGGPRACIGFKFSQLEMKVALAALLPAFMFEPTGRPIYWKPAGVVYPVTSPESKKPEMPLKVTCLL